MQRESSKLYLNLFQCYSPLNTFSNPLNPYSEYLSSINIMSDVWRCCQCQTANLLALADVKCPVCDHTRDASCKVGQPTPPGKRPYPDSWSHGEGSHRITHRLPRTSSLASDPRSLLQSAIDDRCGSVLEFCKQSYSGTSSSGSTYGTADAVPPFPTPVFLAHSSARHRAKDSGFSSTPSIHTLTTPSTKGWWYCCNGHHNNPSLAPDRCSQCQHWRCGSCTLYRK